LSANGKIDLILITGFLGSGKTTLVNQLLEKYKSKRVGLIINDFGKVAVDGIFLSNFLDEEITEGSIYEIKNGSIFCTCLSAELVKALKQFSEIKPDILIIETSGLSDPTTFGVILEQNKLNDKFNVLSSICIVDPNSLLKLSKQILAIERQIKSSDIIIVNKSDITEKSIIVEVNKFIEGVNSSAEIVITNFSRFNFSLIENRRLIHDKGGESCNTVSNRPAALLLNSERITKRNLSKFYAEVSGTVLRLKGFVFIGQELYYVTDNVGHLQFKKFPHRENLEIGISVLLAKDKVQDVLENWENFVNKEQPQISTVRNNSEKVNVL
jgi:G3E family GTPase